MKRNAGRLILTTVDAATFCLAQFLSVRSCATDIVDPYIRGCRNLGFHFHLTHASALPSTPLTFGFPFGASRIVYQALRSCLEAQKFAW